MLFFSLITQTLTSALNLVVQRASWRVEKKGKQKKVMIHHTIPHRAMFKTFKLWRISNKPQQCQQVSTQSKSTCPNQISKQELNTLIQWVHRWTMRTLLPHNSFFIDLNSIWFRQMFKKRTVALEIGLFIIHKMPYWYKAKKKII